MIGAFANLPLETIGFVEVPLEGFPVLLVNGRVRVADPESEHVVDESFHEDDFVVSVGYGVFVDGVVENGISASWRGAHGGARFLFEHHVPKGEDVVFHDQAQGVDGGFDWDVEVWILSQVVGDSTDGSVGGDVGVHGDCIGCEESGSQHRDIKIEQECLQVVGVLDVGSLLLCWDL